MSPRLTKKERLCSRKDITSLFESGTSVRQGVLVAKWLLREKRAGEGEVKMLFSVPKRNLKRAPDRNRVKRLLREHYRLNKSIWTKCEAASNKTMWIAVIYTARVLPGHDALARTCEALASKIKLPVETRE